VGFLDGLLGGKRKLKAPAPDRLFAMSTAYVALDTELGLKSRAVAGIVFQPLATADFEQLVRDSEELLHGSAGETGTEVETHEDSYDYRWIVLRDDDFDDLVVSVNTVSVELQGGGYGDRLLAAVFAFEDEKKRHAYFIYNFKRGAYYPFVPTGDKERNTERELQLKAQLSNELPIEQELERWFPLWDLPL
jgi:hypothetical protein